MADSRAVAAPATKGMPTSSKVRRTARCSGASSSSDAGCRRARLASADGLRHRMRFGGLVNEVLPEI